jgi:uroporphyrinogen-III synthase
MKSGFMDPVRPAVQVRRGFDGCRVLALESRRAADMQRLIARSGGVAAVVPSMREVPRESNAAALAFARDLEAGAFAAVIFLTGVGTRALVKVIEPVLARDRLSAALSRTDVVARGPKPAAALRQLGVTSLIAVPAPHTWREVLHLVDARPALRIKDRRVAVQEYGISNDDLIGGLRARGAYVTPVPVYEWALPEDAAPLRDAVAAAARGDFDVLIFTTSAQVHHLMQVARQQGIDDGVRHACERLVVASIGPSTTETLLEYGLPSDLEPSRSNMGLLVMETAVRSGDLLRRKRAR